MGGWRLRKTGDGSLDVPASDDVAPARNVRSVAGQSKTTGDMTSFFFLGVLQKVLGVLQKGQREWSSVGEARASGPRRNVLERAQQISGVGVERPQLVWGIATLRLGAQATA